MVSTIPLTLPPHLVQELLFDATPMLTGRVTEMIVDPPVDSLASLVTV